MSTPIRILALDDNDADVSFGDELSAPLIQKPYSIGDLGRKVREVLDKRPK